MNAHGGGVRAAVGPLVVLTVLALMGCKTAVRPQSPDAMTPHNTPNTVADLAAAIAADAQRSDAEPDAKVRDQLSEDASRDAKACLARDPGAAACLYYRAIAWGLEARAHPLHAAEFLKAMLDALSSAEAADRGYDHGGSARVRALVLLKAPGWPLGPGDADAGLIAARRAVAIDPSYPPNVLALAEASSKTGDAEGARRAYAQARELAEAMSGSVDRDDWLHQADQGLRQ